MTEGKIIIPAYFRKGKCEACGADVYAPGTESVEGGLPPMSSCACVGGPKIASESESQLSSMKRASNSQEQAKAA